MCYVNRLKPIIRVLKMPENICKAPIKLGEQTVMSNAVLCTKDVELHLDILTRPR